LIKHFLCVLSCGVLSHQYHTDAST